MKELNIKNALAKVGVTDERQNEFLAAFEGKSLGDISKSDFAAELAKLGVTDEKALDDFLAAVKEPEILEQSLELDELKAVVGGDYGEHDADKDSDEKKPYPRSQEKRYCRGRG